MLLAVLAFPNLRIRLTVSTLYSIFENVIAGVVSEFVRPQFGLAVLVFLITQLRMLLAVLAFSSDLQFWHFWTICNFAFLGPNLLIRLTVSA